MRQFEDLTGRTFGRLTVIGLGQKTKWGQLRWECKCECGKLIHKCSNPLISGTTRSCGCLRRDVCTARATKHGGKTDGVASREYKSWQDAKSRCFNPNNINYKNYGGRGITMCLEWRDDFREFFSHMGPCPKGKSLDRIDNEKNYEPGNCQWASRAQQNANQRRSRKMTYLGKTQSACEWCKELGLNPGTVYQRLFYGWSDERALSQPVK